MVVIVVYSYAMTLVCFHFSVSYLRLCTRTVRAGKKNQLVRAIGEWAIGRKCLWYVCICIEHGYVIRKRKCSQIEMNKIMLTKYQ